MTEPQTILMHATCVALGERAALLRGKPGSGKSDLALRFLFLPSQHLSGPPALVADDQVCLFLDAAGLLMASSPAAIAGRMEVRGLGIINAPAVRPLARVCLLVDLVPEDDVPRFPDASHEEEVLGCKVPRLLLSPFPASAPMKLALALQAARKTNVE